MSLTTHYLDEADALDRILIMDHGRVAGATRPAGGLALATHLFGRGGVST